MQVIVWEAKEISLPEKTLSAGTEINPCCHLPDLISTFLILSQIGDV
ncbi:MAG: hypothetical protein H0V61_08995 [Chitinophagales bacterium]|nr:hypothetical protein [Chitinophagales bacterium]